MQNKGLVKDYIERAGKRLLAVEVLVREKSWADVVRESQEIVELSLKALLRSCGVEVPRVHDVSALLEQERSRLPQGIVSEVDYLIFVSKSLRRDRELAFYGSEDLTPSDFYSEKDGREAFEMAKKTRRLVAGVLSDRSV